MKNQLAHAITGLFLTLTLTSCNGGINLTAPGREVISAPDTAEFPTPTPIPSPTPNNSPTPTPSPTATPVPSPSPTPVSKNRIFVLNATLKSINTQSAGFFNYACYRDAMRARIPGKFIALVATSDAEFTKKHKVNGYIYQKLLGVENRVADSIQDLFAGKNDSIYALANQLAINSSVKNYVWSGQRNFNQPASKNENCNDWTTNSGDAVVGLAGATGSDALANRTLSCNEFIHLYCVQVND
jgi:hypothetical protein